LTVSKNLKPTGSPRTDAPLALGLLGHDIQRSVASVAAVFDLQLSMDEQSQEFRESLERRSPDIVLIDSDVMTNPCDVCELARSRNPMVKILIAACFWSEREEALQCCADVVVHKPVRQAEWNHAFVMLGVSERTQSSDRVRLESA
jgi:DNA-binding response OmpR family regulator